MRCRSFREFSTSGRVTRQMHVVIAGKTNSDIPGFISAGCFLATVNARLFNSGTKTKSAVG